MSEVAAGWYPDPDGKPADRFWDGESWSDRTRPATTPNPPEHVQPVIAQRPSTNVLAILALVSAFVVPLILPIVLGYIALGQIRRTDQEGRSLALAAVIIGWVFLAFIVLWAGAIFILFDNASFAGAA